MATFVESVLTHSDDNAEKGILFTDNLIHSSEDVVDLIEEEEEQLDEEIDIEEVFAGMSDEQKEAVKTIYEFMTDQEVDEESVKHSGAVINEMDENKQYAAYKFLEMASGELQHADEQTIGDVIDTMTDEQKEAVYALIGLVAEQNTDEEEKGDEEVMKQNVFNKGSQGEELSIIKHSLNEVLKQAQTGKVSSLRDFLAEQKDDTLTHGINSIEMLFPDAAQSTNGGTPIIYKDPNTGYQTILSRIAKSPFSRVKTTVADLTEEEARAKGYIKGNLKKEEFFSLIKRTTTPTTVYKKQKLDRDDILDITEFDVVSFMNAEMRMMLEEELARAALVGDGRDFSSEDKINENHIRPIIGDHEFFTIHASFTAVSAFIEAVIKAMADYRGSGNPDMYIDPTLLADVKLLKATDGRFLFGDIPSNEAIANRLGIREIIPTTFMSGKGAVIVNLRDYTFGAAKGGQVTNFEDFDIDFNQHKYLIETRLCGALTLPKSAVHLKQGTAGTGADATKAGLQYGQRQSDKTTPPAGE